MQMTPLNGKKRRWTHGDSDSAVHALLLRVTPQNSKGRRDRGGRFRHQEVQKILSSLSAAGSKGQRPAEMQIKKANVAVRQRSSGFLSESYFRHKQAFDGSRRRRRRREVPYGTKRKAKRQKTPHGGRLKTSLKLQTAAAPQTSRRCNRRRLSPLPRLKQGRGQGWMKSCTFPSLHPKS